ncbi:DinB family protein [Arthrobacter livingstonensis]|uniref:DinB family protein n=1 Tax=Arthrobacter livingstonensis TaxID=670078 RepID=A0A2V5LCW1_9MICC|nr:DinB family protein [Arthrobacter livingstonensis]PYI69419.1 DinB family protein [Arthrobacter livingstonensis]
MDTPTYRTPEVPDVRTGPSFMAGERESLEAWLEFYRETLPLKVGGLTAGQLCQPAVPPSTMTIAGIVRHLTDVERYWFSNVAAGSDQPARYRAVDRDADFTAYSEATALADVAAYTEELRQVRRLAAEVADLNAPLAGLRHGQELNLRWVYTHMIEEYARHLGHVDLLRECIDGTTGY